jgi:hypothetical protein
MCKALTFSHEEPRVGQITIVNHQRSMNESEGLKLQAYQAIEYQDQSINVVLK